MADHPSPPRRPRWRRREALLLPAALSTLAGATPGELVETLRHKNMFWRKHAQRLLVERGVRAVDGGYVWSSDSRLTQPSLTRMTCEQVDDVLDAITCPTLAIFATPAQPYLPDAERQRRVQRLAQGQLLLLPGGHHLHMQQPAHIAGAVHAFLQG